MSADEIPISTVEDPMPNDKAPITKDEDPIIKVLLQFEEKRIEVYYGVVKHYYKGVTSDASRGEFYSGHAQ
ncbi:hypothetical protein BGZ76_005935, partial [Entomortierella beljakovae]